MKRTRIQAIRAKLAGFILGEQFALFMPKSQKGKSFDAYSDEELAGITRRFIVALEESLDKVSLEKGIPIETFTIQSSVLAFAHKMQRANAESMEFTVGNFDSGDGSLTGNYRLVVSKLPEDYEFSKPGVTETWDDDKLVRVEISWSHPHPNPLHGKMAGSA